MWQLLLASRTGGGAPTPWLPPNVWAAVRSTACLSHLFMKALASALRRVCMCVRYAEISSALCADTATGYQRAGRRPLGVLRCPAVQAAESWV